MSVPSDKEYVLVSNIEGGCVSEDGQADTLYSSIFRNINPTVRANIILPYVTVIFNSSILPNCDSNKVLFFLYRNSELGFLNIGDFSFSKFEYFSITGNPRDVSVKSESVMEIPEIGNLCIFEGNKT